VRHIFAELDVASRATTYKRKINPPDAPPPVFGAVGVFEKDKMKLRLVMLGKTRRTESRALLDDYVSRIRHFAPIEVTELREASAATLRKLKLDPASTVVLLDAAGKSLTTPQFARWLGTLRDSGSRELVFLCGDADGFPEDVRSLAREKISLSPLTMPHEFARVLLAEQIYRSFTILHGHPYSK
jgi:23S rRNA (pseudouridine1915-N3)-methyltransferase